MCICHKSGRLCFSLLLLLIPGHVIRAIRFYLQRLFFPARFERGKKGPKNEETSGICIRLTRLILICVVIDIVLFVVSV